MRYPPFGFPIPLFPRSTTLQEEGSVTNRVSPPSQSAKTLEDILLPSVKPLLWIKVSSRALRITTVRRPFRSCVSNLHRKSDNGGLHPARVKNLSCFSRSDLATPWSHKSSRASKRTLFIAPSFIYLLNPPFFVGEISYPPP